MADKKTLNVLGFVPTLINVLVELAHESNGIEHFRVIKNIPVDNYKFFKPLPDWNVDFIEFHKEAIALSAEDQYALAVVGVESKEAVYQTFKKLVRMKDEQFINMIHPTSYVSKSAELNYGLQLEPLSAIASCTTIGFGVNIKRNCSIGHHCEIGDFVTINPGVTMSGEAKIGNNTMIGSGASIRDEVRIGKNSIIGMGSVVVKDIPSNSIAFGNPCVVHKTNHKKAE